MFPGARRKVSLDVDVFTLFSSSSAVAMNDAAGPTLVGQRVFAGRR